MKAVHHTALSVNDRRIQGGVSKHRLTTNRAVILQVSNNLAQM